jgi:predicted alpha/beta hydrolase family esterase
VNSRSDGRSGRTPRSDGRSGRTLEPPTIVIVPGLRGHVEDHWQSLLAARLAGAGRSVHTVPPLTEGGLGCDERVAALEQVVSGLRGPIQLVAHSAGVMITVHWALRYGAAIEGALLAAPPDFDTPLPAGYPTPDELAENGWIPTPRTRLAFPSIVATSADDPLGREDRIIALAEAWGSHVVRLGEVGHLNPASGYGDWPLAEELLAQLD